jgi:hypothetical protein
MQFGVGPLVALTPGSQASSPLPILGEGSYRCILELYLLTKYLPIGESVGNGIFEPRSSL